jgi:hypothetical protein
VAQFRSKHAGAVIGTLSGFDRLVLRGTLRMLAHRLIRKVPHTHRYHLTQAGRISVTALITARNASAHELTKLAA